MNKRYAYLLVLLLLLVPITQAEIQVIFSESAPKDRFTIKNNGECNLENISVEIDLSMSSGKLLFDTIETGPGEDVFQPFEVADGIDNLKLAQQVSDGDAQLTLSISTLQPKQSVSFTIDVDDTLINSELRRTRVTGSEIQNGVVVVSGNQFTSSQGTFDSKSSALVLLPSCKS